MARIVTADGDLEEARAGEAVTLVLARDVDVARGDVLAAHGAVPEIVDQFAAHVLWMDADALLPGRAYVLRIGTRYVPARVTTLKHRLDVTSGEHLAAPVLRRRRVPPATSGRRARRRRHSCAYSRRCRPNHNADRA